MMLEPKIFIRTRIIVDERLFSEPKSESHLLENTSYLLKKFVRKIIID